MKLRLACMAGAVLATMAGPASAVFHTLTFEKVGDLKRVGSFYAGVGGPNWGVTFTSNAQGLVDSDAGGSGDFANEPSASTIMILSDPLTPNTVMRHQDGFIGRLTFRYTSTEAAFVAIYAGRNLGGTTGRAPLASMLLKPSNDDDCVGDPNGSFCGWNFVSMPFAGVARSVDFRATAGATGWDNVRFDARVPVAVPAAVAPALLVPEPQTWALMLLGMASIGYARLKGQRS